MLSLSKKLKNEDNVILIFALFFIAAGIYFRFHDIGKWCFAVDEFFTATSVSKILDNGIPLFPNGGYYMRGLLFQYFEAFLSLIWGFNEGTLRYGSVFFNLLSLPALYLLGKRIGGKTLGLAAICIFSISLWEIEFSRFIRMYTAFQCVFLWYLFVLLKVIVDKDKNKIKWLYFIAVCSVFVYEGSIFIVLLLFLPLIFEFPENKRKHILISLIILLCAYVYLRFDFRHFGTNINPLPPDYHRIATSPGSGSMLPGLYFLKTIFATKGWLLFYGLLAALSSYFTYKLFKDTRVTYAKKIVVSIIALLGLLQMFGVCVLFLLMSLIAGTINIRDFKNKTIRNVTGCLGVVFVFWFFYGIFTDLWISCFANLSEASTRKILAVLFKYPNILKNLIYPWMRTVPLLSVCLLLSSFYIMCVLIFQRRRDNFHLRVITVSSLICISLIGVIKLQYPATRYSFFLYPTGILLFLFAVKHIINLSGKIKYQSAIFFFSSMFLFMISDDFNLNHLVNMSSPEINFRMNYSLLRKIHFYMRSDFKSPADFINNNAGPNDIVISTVVSAAFYLNKLDYVFMGWEEKNFPNHSVLKGTKEFWTSTDLIYRLDDLYKLIDNGQKDVWVIEYAEKYPWEKNAEKKISGRFSEYRRYSSIDGHLWVLNIPSKK